MKIKKAWIQNILLFSFSSLLSLAIAEGLTRLFLFSQDYPVKLSQNSASYAIYPTDASEAFYSDDYWKLNHIFGLGMNVENPHPLLGWISNKVDWSDYAHVDNVDTGSKRPVLFFGDSFTQCIDSVVCFEDYLNSDSTFSRSHVLLNYGTGGYGLDQIYLLAKEVIPLYDNPHVVFSFLTTDFDRSMLTFRDAQKPYFKLNNDRLELNGVPITKSTKDFVEENPPEINSYFLSRVFNVVTRNAGLNIPNSEDYIHQVKQLNGKILEKSIDLLDSLGLDYSIVIFHPAYYWERDWRLEFAESVFKRLEVPYVRDIDLMNAHREKTGRHKDTYVVYGDGHPSSLANSVMSNYLKTQILE